MQAIKYTVTVTAEALSLDCIPKLLLDVVAHLDNEMVEGKLHMDDGDMVAWHVEKKSVTF